MPIQIYLDTSVVNFLFAEDSPEKRDVTRELFATLANSGVYAASISTVVERELQRTSTPEHRARLLAVASEYRLSVIDAERIGPELQRLAAAYLEAGVLPRPVLLPRWS